ncbi:[FeFe] hydrogenase H-cluster maturation GTPase HydF [Acetivibrio sp. MSJd-27]|uniref:[FeFe] hydrogenase H-cluster maturation GTPase HydF n=1 Tax=Acetivibrio sp. MSJd-27 TaxID=2841523 RepID=UPI001C1109EC|nr:[FeFe] hydrogenase H-cluster maturation GTPase HydF [Acetivibrio sp. MSJd-27]MBU5450641.1 [FeFe] hydrogenase H-cluster maturation GTPase HydF [Acetivibrio sp. MSJd-27]
MNLNNTPRSERLHIAFFGKRNSGKSSLINAVTNQETALVSDVLGTTTDPVYKSMEVLPLGPCVFIDTAGFDDQGELGKLRIEKTRGVIERTDIAVMVFADTETTEEEGWIAALRERDIPVVAVVNKIDILPDAENVKRAVKENFGMEAISVSAQKRENISLLMEALVRMMPEEFAASSITSHLVKEDDVVLLVMPQDIQAPKGRLILPQVQTIRDLLDNKCIVMSVTTDKLAFALDSLKRPPKLIVTDSQVFGEVYEKKPPEAMLTSFSVLFARYKGDIQEYVRGSGAVETLSGNSRILIAEACTHKPLDEDIGRVKIPRLLRKKYGDSISIDIVNGSDFPKDLTPYDLVIHCGACMFNRRYVLSRITQAKRQRVPITNYGVFLAKMTGILDKIDL